MNKIVIASDSFKGSATSAEIATRAKTAVCKIFPNCKVVKVPVADGGEGTVEAILSSKKGEFVTCSVNDPLMNPILATYGILEDGKTALIEMASACGLNLISVQDRNPMLTSTFGTGELIRDALSRGCTDFLIGIGGSATNDAGTGMLQALGYRFFDKNNKELGMGGQILENIEIIDDSQVPANVKTAKYTLACDVSNPFSGINGAAHVYAPQKGADDQMVARLDKGLKNFAGVIKREMNRDVEGVPGAGAAGGIAGGFLAFLNAKLKPGIDMVLDSIDFDHLIEGADLIITGEGKLDSQTEMGKAPVGVLKRAQSRNISVLAIGGAVERVEEFNKMGFLAVLPILPYPVTQQQAMDKDFTLENVRRTLEQQFRIIQKYYPSK